VSNVAATQIELIPSPGASKHCPLCARDLPLTEFGVCRARKDGRNLYCKSCIRQKVTESRRALKAYKSAREKSVMQKTDADIESSVEGQAGMHSASARQLSKLSPVERVREAIRKGARTQREIAQQTRLGKDEIGDALANLLLWTREVRTEVVDGTRKYFINELADDPADEDQRPRPRVPRRKRDVPSSFSSLQVLMPGKNPDGETEKAGGWVAA
jgi:uncharacterized Zn finger protein (UPF0148 family)